MMRGLRSLSGSAGLGLGMPFAGTGALELTFAMPIWAQRNDLQQRLQLSHGGQLDWMTEFRRFARWTTIQESLSRACKYIALGADRYAADIFTDKGSQTRKVFGEIMLSILPLLAALMACVFIMLVLQRAIAFSTKKLKPDLKKINPIENIKNKYGQKGLTDFLQDAAKMIFAGLIAAYFMSFFAANFYAGSAISKGQLVDFTLGQVVKLIIFFASFQLLLALMDVPMQRYRR